jgi:hypothetical protein
MKQAGVVLAIAVATLSPQPGEAQGRSDREWQNNVFVYGVLPAINGDARVGPIEEPVDVSIGDFLDKLQMGFMGAALGDSSDSGLIRRADVDQLIVDVTGGYRFSNGVEAFAGMRLTDISTKIGLGDPIRREFEPSKTFYDPIFGARVIAPLDEGRKWWLQAYGDIGGFGVSMDFTWQAMANVGFKPREWISIWGGYRALGQDFDDEVGQAERFGMDVTYHGPSFGVGFHF